MKLIAARQLRGEYGLVDPGASFNVRDEIGRDLLRRGLARPTDPPAVLYETKVIAAAPEVGARLPFRDLSLSDPQSSAVAAEGDRVFSPTDLPAMRSDDHRGRRGRSRSGSGA